MVNYKIYNSILDINGKQINFKYQIRDVKDLNGLIIIVLENAMSGKVSEQPVNNIYAIKSNGDISWNIKEIVNEDSFYPGIRIENSMLVAVNVIGVNYSIDVRNKIVVGKIGVK